AAKRRQRLAAERADPAAEGDDVEPLADRRREAIDQSGIEVAGESHLAGNLQVIVLRAERGAADFRMKVGLVTQNQVAGERDGGGAVARPQVALHLDDAGPGERAGAALGAEEDGARAGTGADLSAVMGYVVVEGEDAAAGRDDLGAGKVLHLAVHVGRAGRERDGPAVAQTGRGNVGRAAAED